MDFLWSHTIKKEIGFYFKIKLKKGLNKFGSVYSIKPNFLSWKIVGKTTQEGKT